MKTTKRIFIVFTVLLLLVTGIFFRVSNNVPDVAFTTLDGEKLSLESLQGKPVIVTFWATDCESCLKEITVWRDLYSRYHTQGLEIIGASMYYDPPNHVIELNKAYSLPYPITLDIDAKLADAFGGVKVTPTSFLLNSKGEIVWKKVGLFAWSELTPLIETFLKE